MFPYSDTRSSGRLPFITIGLILANAFVFFLEMTSPDLNSFIGHWALIPANVNFADPSTLVPFISSQFLHGGWLHIAGNMLFLWVFGDNVENRLGFFYLPFYLVGGVAAGLTQFVISSSSTVPNLGASGAIAAVLGAYLFLYPGNRVKTLVIWGLGLVQTLELPATFMLGYWFVLQIFSGVSSLGAANAQDQGGVAYFAHIGGFAFGWLASHLFSRPADASDSL